MAPAKISNVRVKVALILSNIYKAVSHEWTAALIDKDRFELFVIIMNPASSPLEDHFKAHKVPCLVIPYHGKYDLPKAIIRIGLFLRKHRINVVHAHLFDASLAGLTAAFISGIASRIYTRHHGTFHHEYFPAMVKYDKLINKMATKIIAPSRVVMNVLIEKEKVPPEKVRLIHHGFRFEEWEQRNETQIEQLKSKYGISGSPVIGVISRWTKWKGIQYTISAFKKLLAEFPEAQLVLANAKGDYASAIYALLAEIRGKNVCIIPFEEDFPSLYRLFTLFVHVPVNGHCEAFGQVYVEALALGIPSVFTLSGIANEFIKDEENALVVGYENSAGIFGAMKRLLADEPLRNKLITNGKRSVHEQFGVKQMIESFEAVYAV
jgi:glycosyltransferase involved in cell wall biosynthesis